MTSLVAMALLTPGASRWTAHASGATLTVSPGSNLADGQFVALTLTGFTPGGALALRQCSANPVNIATDCTVVNPTAGNDGTVSLDATGSGRAFMPVYDAGDQNLASSDGSATLNCDVNHPCTLAAMPNPSTLTTATLAAITFAPSPNLCPPVSAGRVVGSGSAAAGKAMYRWESTVCGAPQSLPIAYTPQNSPDGVSSFLGGATQYAITGPWATGNAPTSTRVPPQTWDYAPLTNSAIVIAFLLFDQRTGAQITKLTLTPDLVAQVFSGSLSVFGSDPGVAALNPHAHLTDVVHAFVRSEHDSDTWEFTSWLAGVAGPSWVYPGGAHAGEPIGATDTFPPTLADEVVTGADTVGSSMISQVRAVGTSVGWFGYMDSSTAAYFGLPTVSIKRADGSVTAPTAATVTQALADGTGNPDGTITPDYTTTDPAAWPMPEPTYLLAPTNSVSPADGATLAAFLHYTAGPGQAALPPGYVPLTTAQAEQTLTAAAAIPTTAAAAGASVPGAAGAGLTPEGFASPGLPPDGLGQTSTPSPDQGSPSGRGAQPNGAVPTPRSATVTSAQLALASDGFAAVAPAIAGTATLCLLAAVVLDVVRRVRRFRAGGAASGLR